MATLELTFEETTIMLKRVLTPLFVIFLLASSVKALTGDKLSEGMSYGEVVAAAGSPLSKQEFESKREDTWDYEDTEVYFKEGVVTSWKIKEGFAKFELSREPEAPEDAEDQKLIEDLLQEIIGGGDGTDGPPADKKPPRRRR